MSTGTPTDHSLPEWAALFDQFPWPMQVYLPDGTLVAINKATQQMWGFTLDAVASRFNILEDAQAAQWNIQGVFTRVLRGETFSLPPHFFDTRQTGMPAEQARQLWVEATYFPLRDNTGTITHVCLSHRDVTAEAEHRQEAETVRQELDTQRETILQLSTPVVQVWPGILTLPLVGIIDARRAEMITESLLEAIVYYQAEHVIIDITGVAVVDTQVANYLISAASACRLLGSQVVLVGIGSSIAQTMVHLGVDLGGIVSRADLQAGLAWVFERQGLTVTERMGGNAVQSSLGG